MKTVVKIKKIKLPVIFEIENISNYFKKMIELNIEVSQRSIAHQLNWPVSYLPDLIQKRKPLTMQRCYEFARFVNLNPIEFDRLIWMTLAESSDELTKPYLTQKISLKPTDYIKETFEHSDFKLLYYVNTVLSCYLTKDQVLTAQEIQKYLNLKNLETKYILNAKKYIEKNKVVIVDQKTKKITDFNYRVIDDFNETDGKPFVGIETHSYYSKNFDDYIKSPISPSTYQAGYVSLRKEQFMPLALEIINFRNRIIDISIENLKQKHENMNLLQFNFNLFKVNKKVT